MKPSDIAKGKTYRNRGKGTTQRTVIGIGKKYQPVRWYGDPENHPPSDAPGVMFHSGGYRDWVYLSVFAQWAGSEVTDGDN